MVLLLRGKRQMISDIIPNLIDDFVQCILVIYYLNNGNLDKTRFECSNKNIEN